MWGCRKWGAPFTTYDTNKDELSTRLTCYLFALLVTTKPRGEDPQSLTSPPSLTISSQSCGQRTMDWRGSMCSLPGRNDITMVCLAVSSVSPHLDTKRTWGTDPEHRASASDWQYRHVKAMLPCLGVAKWRMSTSGLWIQRKLKNQTDSLMNSMRHLKMS